ncbi:MAG TPA: BTAD domain-containing putative transcriptional regulator [Gemmatimonadaceae bacterium]
MTTPPPEIPASPAELPAPLTCFIGRARELDDLARLAEGARLLTLTGAGGSGKTRLAREAALRVAPAFGQVAWVDLSAVEDEAGIGQSIATALHVPDRGDAGLTEGLVAALAGRRALLVLDNCEHLVAGCAAIAEVLLRACPSLTILATSREALGIAGETAWLVPPLDVREAVQLFVDRARATLPTFTYDATNAAAVEEICRRLDGIPLAIELAAARVRVLSPGQVAQRLDQAFHLLSAGSRTALPRHRTLRATMDWSFALLCEREQVLLRRLAAFPASFTLDAAEAVCAGAPLHEEDILDGVAALVDKSLVVMQAGDRVARYRLLETVRQYAMERLAAAGEREALEERHAAYYLALAEALAPQLLGGEAVPGTVARLAAENENLRAVMGWSVQADARIPLALRLADALFWYWFCSTMGFGAGHFSEARRFVNAALARSAAAPPVLRGRALMVRGLIGLSQGDYHDATLAFDEALALVRAHDGLEVLVVALAKAGATRLMLGDLEGAWALVNEAHQRIPEIAPPGVLHSFTYSWRGMVARARGDLATARAMHEENLRVGEATGHRTILGLGHAFLAAVELAEGHDDAAFAHFSEALPYHVELGDAWGLALCLEGLAAMAIVRKRYADAARLLGAVDALRERSAVALPATDAEDRARRVALARGKLGAAFDAAYAEGRELPMDEVVRLATDDAVLQTAEHRIPVAEAARARNSGAIAPRLRVHALGPLEVFVGGVRVEPSAWGSARPRELLAYLLLHPEGRTKEQVGLAFWPDASPAQLRNNFHVTLHRLRRALGHPEWVVLVHDRYRIDPAVLEEFDVAAFEKELGEARHALKRQAEGAAARLEQVLARFRGDLLDGEPVGDWHLDTRDRLQRLYVDALMELGARLAGEERHAKAAEAYRRVLARDELHEEALVALMQCHAAAGERAQAMRAYTRFASRMQAELEATPGAEAMQCFERLQRAGA